MTTLNHLHSKEENVPNRDEINLLLGLFAGSVISTVVLVLITYL